jgi:hypothetical protein
LWSLNRCTKPTQVPARSRLAWEMDIIYVDTLSSEVIKKSSSYNLSIFSSGADFEGAEVVTATREDSRPSIKELWPNIDKLDNLSREDTSVVHARNYAIRGKRSDASIEDTDKRSRREGKRDSLPDITGTSDFRSKGHEGGSARMEAVRILSAAEAIAAS